MRRNLVLTGLLIVSLFAGVAPAAAQPADVTLTVSVVTESGDPVGGASIEATWEDGETTARTASNGKAFIDVPEGADVSLAAESENYIRNRPLVVEDATAREVNVTVAPKGELTVDVTDTQGVVENARVRLIRDGETIASGTTNADGSYTTPAVEQGDYFLELSKAGYYRNLTRETVGESTQLNKSMRRGTTNVAFRVVDDHFSPSEQLSDVRVEVADIGSQRITDGTVTFTLPVNSRYTVTATKDGYQSNTTTVSVGTTSGERTLVINRERALNVTAANERVVVGETVQVTVRNEYDEPVADADVRVSDETVATTNTQGTARVPIETAGNRTITVESDGVSSEPLVILGIATATPEPDTTPTATPTATAVSSPSPTPDELPVGMPGFTPVAAVVAMLAVALLARRRA